MRYHWWTLSQYGYGISFGPNITGPHSPDERVEIQSVQKFYKYFIEVLKRIPERIKSTEPIAQSKLCESIYDNLNSGAFGRPFSIVRKPLKCMI